MNWAKLVEYLSSEIEGCAGSMDELREQGLVHAVDFIMRGAIGSQAADDEAKAKRNELGKIKVNHLLQFIKATEKQDKLWSSESLKTLQGEIENLRIVSEFVLLSLNEGGIVDESSVRIVEPARNVLAGKRCRLVKCLTALQVGLWMMETVQESLTEFHGQAALRASLEKGSLV